ncbi:MAG TPA: nucleoside/nucleotide kinase family protein [Micromonosporaceae bacterium]|nr:nucleoside/nucleotide kinase family protein [Micromonosporaceae bacterium]
MTPEVLGDALAAVAPLVPPASGRRLLVGIAGPPGAGKSTLASALAAELRRGHGAHAAVAVPMDGFHLANAELERLGLTNRKGAPETFDAAGFVHLLRRLRAADETVYAPAFNRTLNEAVAGAIPVAPEVGTVVLEGNYLLLRKEPWSGVRPLLDLAVYLDAPERARTPALLRRQRSRGLTESAARAWVNGSDAANARITAATRDLADVVLTRSGP